MIFHDCHLDACDSLIQIPGAFCNTYKRITDKNCAAYTHDHMRQNDNCKEKSYRV